MLRAETEEEKQRRTEGIGKSLAGGQGGAIGGQVQQGLTQQRAKCECHECTQARWNLSKGGIMGISMLPAIGRCGEMVTRWSTCYLPKGHIVWADENFDTDDIQWCIENAEKYRKALSDEDLALAVESLKELLAVPEEIRCCEPKDYGEDSRPEDFPPPAGVEMDRKRC